MRLRELEGCIVDEQVIKAYLQVIEADLARDEERIWALRRFAIQFQRMAEIYEKSAHNKRHELSSIQATYIRLHDVDSYDSQ